MLTAQTSSVPLEGAPVWLNAVLIGAPTTLGALATVIYALRGMRKPESDGPETPAAPDPGATTKLVAVPTGPPPTTVDGKLEWAERYVATLERNEAALTAKAAQFEARARQLETQVEQLREQADWFRDQLRETVEWNRYLRSMLDQRPPAPGAAPSPPRPI